MSAASRALTALLAVSLVLLGGAEEGGRLLERTCACQQCCCRTRDCCAREAPGSSGERTPARPATPFQPSDDLGPPHLTQPRSLPSVAEAGLPRFEFRGLFPPAVPLYARNCCFLI